MVVLAAGAWSRPLARDARARRPVRPVRGWIALVAPGAAGAAPRRPRGRVQPARRPVAGRRRSRSPSWRPATSRSAAPRPSTPWASTRTPTARSSSARRGRPRCTRGAESTRGPARERPSGPARWCPASRSARSTATWTGLRPFSPTACPTSAASTSGVGRLRRARQRGHPDRRAARAGWRPSSLLGPAPFTDPAPFRRPSGRAPRRIASTGAGPAGQKLEGVDPLADQHLQPVDDARAPLPRRPRTAASRRRRRGRRGRRRSCPARAGSCRSALKHWRQAPVFHAGRGGWRSRSAPPPRRGGQGDDRGAQLGGGLRAGGR